MQLLGGNYYVTVNSGKFNPVNGKFNYLPFIGFLKVK